MGTKATKTKMPLAAWEDFCISIATISEERENGDDTILLLPKWERMHGFIRALSICGLITPDEWTRLADVIDYAWTGKEPEPCPF